MAHSETSVNREAAGETCSTFNVKTKQTKPAYVTEGIGVGLVARN